MGKEWRHRPRRHNKCLTEIERFKEQTHRDGQYNNEMKNALEGIKSRIIKEKYEYELEDSVVEITAKEQKKEKKEKVRTVSETSITTLTVPRLELQGPQKNKKEKGSEKTFEEIIVKKFH